MTHSMMTDTAIDAGRSPDGSGSHASYGAGQAVSAVPVSIPSAMTLSDAYDVVGEILEYFESYKLATWAPIASIIRREVERERAACVAVAREWRDENNEKAAQAARRDKRLEALGFDTPGMSDMLKGAAIECNALAAALEARAAQASRQEQQKGGGR